MPALAFASFDSPVDGVRDYHNKRQAGVSGPIARIGLPIVNSDPLQNPPIRLGEDSIAVDSPTNLVGLPAVPITVTLVNTLTVPDPTPSASIPVSESPTVPTDLPSDTVQQSASSNDEPATAQPSSDVAQPSVPVVQPSAPIVQPSDTVIQPSNVISSDLPQPSAPADPLPPSPSQPAQNTTPVADVPSVTPSSTLSPSGGGVMLSDNKSPPTINGGLSSSPKMPTGAIVGIVLAIVAVLLLAAIFLVRKTLLRRRRQRNSGGGINWPEEKSFGERFARGQGNSAITPYPFAAPAATGALRPTHQPQMSIVRIPPPPITPSIAPPHFTSAGPHPPLPSAQFNSDDQPPPAVGDTHTVRSTFVTTLPDELNIKMGERVRVLSVYDDGWALCEKAVTLERGMVPMECLVADQSAPIAAMGRAGSLRSVV